MIRKLSFHFMRIFIIRMMGSSIFQGVEGIRVKYGLDGKYVGKMKSPVVDRCLSSICSTIGLNDFCAFLRIEVDGRRKE